MKKLIFIILLSFTFVCNGQLPSGYDFDKSSNTSTKNDLALYFKKLIPKKLLKDVRPSNKNGIVMLSFNFNNENEIYNIKVNSFNRELKQLIISEFKKYPIEKLNIDIINSEYNYSLQIISKQKSRYIINCSSKVILDSQPTCINCEDLSNYYDRKECLLLEVQKHFYKNFNFALIRNKELKSTGKTLVQFKVLKNGQLKNIKAKTHSTLFTNEIIRVLRSFQNIKHSGIINDAASINNYSFSFFSKQNETPKLKKKYTDFDAFTSPNSQSEFSNYFSDNLPTEMLDRSNLNRINSKVLIYFNLDKSGKVTDIRTNSRSEELENSIVSIFKKYPSEKLHIENKHPLNSYFFQVLSYLDNETVVNCSSNINFERVPVYPGCENSKNNIEGKNCLNKQLQLHVAKKFNSDNINYSGLSGKIKIYCQFKFTKTGGVSIINVRAPNASIKLEAYRVINTIPKLKMPGIQNGKPVNVTYMLPISFNVEKPNQTRN